MYYASNLEDNPLTWGPSDRYTSPRGELMDGAIGRQAAGWYEESFDRCL